VDSLDVRAAIDEFTARIDALAPGSGPPLTVTVSADRKSVV